MSKLSGRRFLITGAGGFIGTHLCRSLCASGGEVHAVSRKHRDGANGMRWWEGDVAEPVVARELLSKIRPDVIIHLAAAVTGRRELDVVLPTFRNNLMSTVNLLTVAADVGCDRLVLVGSLEEPDGDTDMPCSPYAASKWSGSGYGRMFHQLYGLPVVIARLFMTYGPEQRDIDKLIPYVTLSLLAGTAPKLSSGSRPIDWIYIDDVVDGLIAISETRGIEGMTLDIGSGSLVTVRSVVERVADLTGASVRPLFGAVPDRPYERVRIADAAHTVAKLGWKAATTLDDGLKRTVAWYREQYTDKQQLGAKLLCGALAPLLHHLFEITSNHLTWNQVIG